MKRLGRRKYYKIGDGPLNLKKKKELKLPEQSDKVFVANNLKGTCIIEKCEGYLRMDIYDTSNELLTKCSLLFDEIVNYSITRNQTVDAKGNKRLLDNYSGIIVMYNNVSHHVLGMNEKEANIFYEFMNSKFTPKEKEKPSVVKENVKEKVELVVKKETTKKKKKVEPTVTKKKMKPKVKNTPPPKKKKVKKKAQSYEKKYPELPKVNLNYVPKDWYMDLVKSHSEFPPLQPPHQVQLPPPPQPQPQPPKYTPPTYNFPSAPSIVLTPSAPPMEQPPLIELA